MPKQISMKFETAKGQQAYNELLSRVEDEVIKFEQSFGPDMTMQEMFSIAHLKLTGEREALEKAIEIDIKCASFHMSQMPTAPKGNLN